ncbi:hypothetical protein ACFWIJ_38965, partial [Streptomyces sp. NPDC127079]|uniref:hypothetical protein n=1 Tax=Streptomyces sp. NPDC127079 TaxID=3347132 RepID=UPI0036553BA3
MSDDGGIGAGIEGGLVAGETPLALLDHFAGLSLLRRECFDRIRCRAGLGEGGEGGGEPVGGEGFRDPGRPRRCGMRARCWRIFLTVSKS